MHGENLKLLAAICTLIMLEPALS